MTFSPGRISQWADRVAARLAARYRAACVPAKAPASPRRGFLFAKRRSVAGRLPRRAAPSCVRDREARADGQGRELVDRVAAGVPVRQLLLVEALGHTRVPFAGFRPDHRAGIELAAVDALLTSQQQRMKDCNSQQQRMKDCNTQASGMAGDARKQFMSSCLSGGSAETKKPHCTMGKPCGNSCIAKDKVCHQP
jgi:psiF repeat